MNIGDFFDRVNAALIEKADEKHANSIQRFFKEPVVYHGVRTPDFKEISTKYFKEIKDLEKEEFFRLCEIFLNTHGGEETGLAFHWTSRIQHKLDTSDFNRFSDWVEKYVTDWAKCDSLCCSSLGTLIIDHRELAEPLFEWTKSENLWKRRASAVALILAVRKNLLVEWAFKTADALLLDKEDMVQKGYGWLLKEYSNVNPTPVFDYVMNYKKVMPRTALRYAIEKLPKDLRAKAMAK